MLHRRACDSVLLLLIVFVSTSCQRTSHSPRADQVPVVSVKGTLTVDGEPQAGVRIRCIPQGDFNYPGLRPDRLGGGTNEQGEFALSTYGNGDGIPAGEYALTFLWPTESTRKPSRAELEKTDRFKGRYARPEKSSWIITVDSDLPLELDLIELTTK